MILFVDISDINNEMETYANYDENIINKVNAPTRTTVSGPSTTVSIKHFFRENSILYGFPHFIKSRKVNSTPASFDPEKNPTINHRRALWTIDNKYYVEYGKAGLEKAKINIIKLKKLLDKYNIKITLVVYPWPTQIYYNDLKSIQVSEWKKFCKKNDINFFNLFPYFISKNSESNKKIILEYYIENDMHWNEKGNQMVANVLIKNLEVFNQNNKYD